jgi:hypothetical protein
VCVVWDDERGGDGDGRMEGSEGGGDEMKKKKKGTKMDGRAHIIMSYASSSLATDPDPAMKGLGV